MKKIETVEIKVIGGKKEDFDDCASCKYGDLPEASCKIIGCVHAFDRLYDYFEREKK